MRKTMPVREYMSRLPEEIDRHETLAAAVERMRARSIRHVPVMDNAQVYGILSQHDALSVSLRLGAPASTVAVGDVCERRTLSVSPTTPIPEVAQQMVERGVTSALVIDEGVLVGIFTSVDALRLLADLRGSAFATDSRN